MDEALDEADREGAEQRERLSVGETEHKPH